MTATTPTPNAPPRSHPMVFRTAASAASIADSSPISELLHAYADDIFALPGVVSISFTTADESLMHVNFRNEAGRAIGAAVLAPTLMGVKLLFDRADWAQGSDQPDSSPLAYEDEFAAVAALPGVVSATHNDAAGGTSGAAFFATTTDDVKNHLVPLVNPTLPGIVYQDGSQEHFDVHWFSVAQ